MRYVLLGMLTMLATSLPISPATATAPTTPAAAEAIGTPGPTLLSAASPRGDWAVVCQARADTNGDGRLHVDVEIHHGFLSGDAMVPYLVWGSGSGEPIERFLGRDPTGRFLLGRTAAGLVLWDADDRRPTVLAAPGDAPDTFAFADGGTHLLYVRGPADAQRLVSRRLADGHEAVFDLDARGLWLLEPAPSGSLVALHFVEADPDAGGPVPAAPGGWSDGGASACRGSPMARSWIPRKGTRNVVRIGRLDGGAPVPAPGFAGFAGQRFLTIEGDGRLVFRTPEGLFAEVASAPCAGVPLIYDPMSDRLGLACTGLKAEREDTSPLYIFEPGRGLTPVGPDAWSFIGRDRPQVGGRWVVTQSVEGSGPDWIFETFVLDLRASTARIHRRRLHEKGPVVGAEIVRRKGQLHVVLPSGRAYPLGIEAPRHFSSFKLSPDRVWVEGRLVDLERHRVLGRTPMPLFLTEDDRVLVPSREEFYQAGLVTGPLQWVRPR
jgi:hypothetical protein